MNSFAVLVVVLSAQNKTWTIRRFNPQSTPTIKDKRSCHSERIERTIPFGFVVLNYGTYLLICICMPFDINGDILRAIEYQQQSMANRL